MISLRPLTCHIPVIPGLIASLALCRGSYRLVSEINGGLVPTMDISPFSTLRNCGNSSRLVLLMKSPTPVLCVPFGSTLFQITLGSKSILNIFPSPSLFSFMSSALRSSASIYMLRNLYILNFFPFFPTRS